METKKRMIVEIDEQNYKAIRTIAFHNEKTIKTITNYLIKKALQKEGDKIGNDAHNIND